MLKEGEKERWMKRNRKMCFEIGERKGGREEVRGRNVLGKCKRVKKG